MKALNELITPENSKKLKETKFPGFLQPMLATLTDDYFDHPQWIYKRKQDGQFGFSEWTKTNKLRHLRFLGMRNDKDAKQVVKEI